MGLLDFFKESPSRPNFDDEMKEMVLRRELEIKQQEAEQALKSMRRDREDLNKKYQLPFDGTLGCKTNGRDYVIVQQGYDEYILNPDDRFSGPMSTLMGTRQKTYAVDAKTVRAILDGHHLPHLDLYRPTPEELEELDELRKEMYRWRRMKKLQGFQKLPAHIRQSIVDEAILKSMMTDRETDPLNQEFDGWTRIQELEQKKGPSIHHHGIRIDDGSGDSGVVYKYLPIINKFTLDELMEAHASASLEDEIAD